MTQPSPFPLSPTSSTSDLRASAGRRSVFLFPRIGLTFVGLWQCWAMVEMCLIHKDFAETDVGRLSRAARFVHHPAFVLVAGAIMLAGVAGIAWGRRPVLSAGVALGAMLALQLPLHLVVFDPVEGFFAYGAVVLAWAVGYSFAHTVARSAPHLTTDQREALGQSYALAAIRGVLAAVYTLAGISKLTIAGVHWADPTTLQAYLLTYCDITGSAATSALRAAVVQFPLVSTGLTLMVLGFQLTAALSPFRWWSRGIWGLFFIGFHFFIYALMGISYFNNLYLLAFLYLPWEEMARRWWPQPTRDHLAQWAATWEPPAFHHTLGRASAVALVVILIAWLLPVSWTP